MVAVLTEGNMSIPVQDDIILGCTIHGEASSESRAVQIRTGQTVLNRFKQHWQPTISSVCLARRQYDCWDPNTKNRTRVFTDYTNRNADLQQSILIARDLIAGTISAPEIKDANMYFVWSTTRPYWAHAPYILVYKDETNEYWKVPR